MYYTIIITLHLIKTFIYEIEKAVTDIAVNHRYHGAVAIQTN